MARVVRCSRIATVIKVLVSHGPRQDSCEYHGEETHISTNGYPWHVYWKFFWIIACNSDIQPWPWKIIIMPHLCTRTFVQRLLEKWNKCEGTLFIFNCCIYCVTRWTACTACCLSRYQCLRTYVHLLLHDEWFEWRLPMQMTFARGRHKPELVSILWGCWACAVILAAFGINFVEHVNTASAMGGLWITGSLKKWAPMAIASKGSRTDASSVCATISRLGKELLLRVWCFFHFCRTY